jgi:hypothetical protein
VIVRGRRPWHTTCSRIASEEDYVNDNSRSITATFVGAIIGGMAGYLLFTPEGRALRRRIEPAIEDVARELSSLRGTVMRASSVASEGWKLLNDALGEAGGSGAGYSNPHQTSPF